MALMEQVSRIDLGPVCFNNGGCNTGACNLFDEMPASDWRSPSRVLEVTVRQAYYLITEKVLRLVFESFGEVEHVHMFEGSDQLLTRVGFCSKHDVVDAFGELHGRCLYAGCCQLDINWGLSQEMNVSAVSGKWNTVTSVSSMQSTSGTIAMFTLHKHNPKKLAVEAEVVASGEHTEATTLTATMSDDIIPIPLATVLDVMDSDDDAELRVLQLRQRPSTRSMLL